MSGREPRLLFEVSAPVRASVEELEALIDSGWLVRELGWGAGSLGLGPLGSGPGAGPSAWQGRGRVGMQGGWWYRGEYTAEQIGVEVRLVHRVFNIANQGWWAPALANRLFIGYRAALQRGTDDLALKATEAVHA
ncbi:hypothetical protein [Pseudonocardia sp. TRM90224]|uniref:hypothetical protein n=1 Tax=Pseudonocardia sp. TRM90224 TaxID=2812678 RepID=UPI001E65C9ED|nr:hypothetical protein [Pseudonocardia sp. TRM90224]